jgi:hypothetical protein
MFQNLMILARLGDLRTQFDLGVLPPLVLRCSSGLSLSDTDQPSFERHGILYCELGPGSSRQLAGRGRRDQWHDSPGQDLLHGPAGFDPRAPAAGSLSG